MVPGKSHGFDLVRWTRSTSCSLSFKALHSRHEPPRDENEQNCEEPKSREDNADLHTERRPALMGWGSLSLHFDIFFQIGGVVKGFDSRLDRCGFFVRRVGRRRVGRRSRGRGWKWRWERAEHRVGGIGWQGCVRRFLVDRIQS